MTDICNGLKHMHDNGVAHHDIKVENILLSNRSFKLCDFGSATTKTLDPDTCSEVQIEDAMEEFEKFTTMMYRPPEMIDKYKKFKVNT